MKAISSGEYWATRVTNNAHLSSSLSMAMCCKFLAADVETEEFSMDGGVMDRDEVVSLEQVEKLVEKKVGVMANEFK
jgi:hypothetical protein